MNKGGTKRDTLKRGTDDKMIVSEERYWDKIGPSKLTSPIKVLFVLILNLFSQNHVDILAETAIIFLCHFYSSNVILNLFLSGFILNTPF